MGTTLTNGIYLPNEGEKNCYAGLKTNWEILDQKVADVTALQQAVAGALHREIVASLPTTDIDPHTIYMILNGTSATENVYNEFMYVNNAWELIGTSATDLTNYYTKGDVDGLLVLKANASDLTSHTGDTTIHVTASDKSKWNTVALIKQLRLVNTQVGSSTTIAFANIDDTNGIKVGDKCMDLDAKMFEITAVDTSNQTVTVGTALIDLALDGNVVHTSGNETVGGQKTFSDTATFASVNVEDIRWKSLANQTVDLNDCYVPRAGAISGYYTIDISSGANISNKAVNTAFTMLSLTTRRVSASDYNVRQVFYGSGAKYTRTCSDGTWTAWVNETDKYVTIDTAQTITEIKTFANTIKSKKEIELTGNRLAYILPEFSASYSGLSLCTYGSNGALKIGTWKVDDNDNTKHVLDTSLGYLSVSTGSANSVNIVYLTPRNSTNSKLGDSTNKWNEINGLTPSSLSMPGDRSARVDISGYFTNMASGDTNTYTAPSNGWIYLALNDVTAVNLASQTSGGLTNYGDYRSRSSNGAILCLFPIRSGDVFVSQWYTTTTVTVTEAYFVPCQGNI